MFLNINSSTNTNEKNGLFIINKEQVGDEAMD